MQIIDAHTGQFRRYFTEWILVPAPIVSLTGAPEEHAFSFIRMRFLKTAINA